MAPVFQIQIDDSQEYHVGGNALTGKLLLVVSGSHALSLKEMILRVICDVETSIEAQVDASGKTKIMKGSMRLYDGEMILPLPSKHFPPGRHEIPFKFPLPSDRPRLPPTATDVQQPTTFGHINYRLKVHARRGASSWFSSGEIKTDESFMFMPASTLTDEHNNAPAMRQQVMSGYVGGAASDAAQSDSFWSRLTGSGSKRRKEPPLEVQCYLNEPTTGLTQDRPTRFQLRIVSSNPEEPVLVQSIALTLETVVTLVANNTRVSNRRASQPLVQAKVLRSGVDVDVSDLLSAVEVRSPVLPTFQTPLITFNYALVVQVTLVRAHHHRGESANIVQRMPIRVLSPFIVGEQEGIAASPPSDVKSEPGLTTAWPPEKSSTTTGPEVTKPRPVRKPVQGTSFAQSPPISHGPTPGSTSLSASASTSEKQKLGAGTSTNAPPSVVASAQSTAGPVSSPAPAVPGTPGIPGESGIPAVPAVPQVSGVLGAPGAPGVPGVPGAAGVPAAPPVPSVPSVTTGTVGGGPTATVTPAETPGADEQHPSEPPPAYYE